MKKLNNKGYMLVEIILACAIAFSVVYFIMDLVIKLKNKNDDLMVETLVKTDQTIITNKLMDYAMDEGKEFSCDELKQGVTDHSVTYKGDLIVVINKYSKIDNNGVTCENNYGKVSIKIPLSVKQMKEDYDIDVDYKYDIGDMTPPDIEFDITSHDKKQYAVITCKDEESGIVGDEITEQALTGTKSVEITHTCVNGAGLETTGSHTYKRVCKEHGEEECTGVCHALIGTGCPPPPAQCYPIIQEYPCPPCYSPCISWKFQK